MTTGGVVAAHPGAAEAGAEMLRMGGNAVDAAVACAFALAVVDPANCGLAGHGGALVYRLGKQGPVEAVDFNTRSPKRFEPANLSGGARRGEVLGGGASVSVPAVVFGLLEAHRRFGRIPRASVIDPAVRLAEGGFVVGKDLARALCWAMKNHQYLSHGFREIFLPNGCALQEGSRCVQTELASTLRTISQSGDSPFRNGWLAERIVDSVRGDGGTMSIDDLSKYRPHVAHAPKCTYRDAVVHGAAELNSGFTVVAEALSVLEGYSLGPSRSPEYVNQLADALRRGWTVRKKLSSGTAAEAQHTTHLCTADSDGGMVSLTFTHGPVWFGSGLLAEGTGLVLNAGCNLLQQTPLGELQAFHYLAPVIVEHASGETHAIGSPGGHRIPAIILQAIVDAVHYRTPLATALMLPRISVTANGDLESEGTLGGMPDEALVIERHQYFGPASALSLTPTGDLMEALDRRFNPSFRRMFTRPGDAQATFNSDKERYGE